MNTQYQFNLIPAQSDLHMHSNFSDGKNTIQQMINAAVEQNLKTVAISDHAPIPIECPCNMIEKNFDNYIKTLEQAQVQNPQIKILKALELDYLEGETPTSVNILDQLDLTVGSVHFLKFKNDFRPIDESVQTFKELLNYFGSINNFASAYVDALASCVATYKPTILGHIDLFIKFNEREKLFDLEDIDWEAIYGPLFSSLPISTLIEINTGAISRGYKTLPYPNIHLLNLIKKFPTIKLVINSDAHSTSGVKSNFDVALKIVKELGLEDRVYSAI